MWIIPSNHPLFSRYAQDFLASKEDLKQLSEKSVSWPTWKSKPSEKSTWLRAWNRVYWIQHLFGRMLKPSMHARFTADYMASLQVIHAQANRSRGFEKAISTKDSFGQLYAELSRQQDLFGATSKTWTTTLRARIRLFTAAYEIWVTRLRQEYTQRVSVARALRLSAYSSLPWMKPMSQDFGGSTRKDFSPKLSEQVRNWKKPTASEHVGAPMEIIEGKDARYKLRDQVKNWARPTCNRATSTSDLFGPNLIEQVKNWAKPNLNDAKQHGQREHSKQEMLITQVRKNSHSGRAQSNGNGKNQERLNPAWAIQLNGTTLQKTFYVPMATWSHRSNQL